MSDDAHDESHAGPSADARRCGSSARRSLKTGVKGTIRFFAPSVIVGLAAPYVFPAIRGTVRPVLKGVIKGALAFAESVKEGATRVREEIADVVAEAQAEREHAAEKSAGAGKANGPA